MRSYPNSIENGAGERLTFLRRVPGETGERLIGEARVAPGAGPLMHVHHLQDESFTVLSGRIGYQIAGDGERFAEAGATVHFPAGQAHRFWNAGDRELHCEAYIAPPGNFEYFLGAIFASQHANGGIRPSLFDAAFLTRRYRSEFEMLVIPKLVQQTVFPLVVAIGHLLGKYAKYADAPEPMQPPG
jgi:quercetin dioxygenase-like cupin family protein